MAVHPVVGRRAGGRLVGGTHRTARPAPRVPSAGLPGWPFLWHGTAEEDAGKGPAPLAATSPVAGRWALGGNCPAGRPRTCVATGHDPDDGREVRRVPLGRGTVRVAVGTPAALFVAVVRPGGEGEVLSVDSRSVTCARDGGLRGGRHRAPATAWLPRRHRRPTPTTGPPPGRRVGHGGTGRGRHVERPRRGRRGLAGHDDRDHLRLGPATGSRCGGACTCSTRSAATPRRSTRASTSPRTWPPTTSPRPVTGSAAFSTYDVSRADRVAAHRRGRGHDGTGRGVQAAGVELLPGLARLRAEVGPEHAARPGSWPGCAPAPARCSGPTQTGCS